MALVKKDAAILVPDKDAERSLVETAINTINDSEKLKFLSVNISKLAQRDSADRIVDEIVKIIG